jgi:SAM-dependent methyltransferase
VDGLDYVLSDEFQTQTVGDATRWDREWLRYFYNNADYGPYFYDMSGENYALNRRMQEIAAFTPEEMFSSVLLKDWGTHVWVPGADLVGKRVLEMGCGPGFFGRLASRFAGSFVGIDMSALALHIAKVASPGNCTYVHLGDVETLRGLANSIDTALGRYFFIHHNYEDSAWILKFLRDLTVPGGTVSADFHSNRNTIGQARRHLASDPLNPDHPSALYHFELEDIESLAKEVDLDIASVTHIAASECTYVLFKVRA